jgi:DNA-directed RNA polymerase II subunit RPB1
LDRKKLLDKNISITEVASKIKREFHPNLAVIFSDENADEQIMRVRFIWDHNLKQEDADDEDRDERWMRKLEKHLLDDVTLRGVKGIERAFIRADYKIITKADDSLFMKRDDKECQEWILDTTGTSMQDVLAAEGVDSTKTYSNSFIEVLGVLGIEAARAGLLKELGQVLSFDGSYVNHRHMALLVDIMTSRGTLMAITRHGINRNETGALMRCSFEETVEILLEAAGMGELDDCRGVSENIMLGQLAPMGTGEFELTMDNNMLLTMVEDNSQVRAGAAGGGYYDSGAATPYDLSSPTYEGSTGGPDYGASFSPLAAQGGDEAGGFSVYGGGSGGYGGASPYSGGTSPYSGVPMSPFGSHNSPTSPGLYGNSSPGYSPKSPGMAISSPRFGGATSPAYQIATSPAYQPTSPGYNQSPASPNYSPQSPAWSPQSPQYSPRSPGSSGTPTSPAYTPTSPFYSPLSPNIGANSDRRSPMSPKGSPTSPLSYSPKSPGNYLSTSPKYSPGGSPGQLGRSYEPTSPKWSPASPKQ